MIRLVFIAILMFPTFVLSNECGSLANKYGPFDYRDAYARKEKLPIVVDSHFTDVTYQLALKGASDNEYMSKFKWGKVSTGTQKRTALPSDIDYTLRAFPNLPKALFAMSEYQRIVDIKTRKQRNYYSAECYFKRAIEFAPDDSAVYLVYGIHYHKRKNYKKALEQYLIDRRNS